MNEKRTFLKPSLGPAFILLQMCPHEVALFRRSELGVAEALDRVCKAPPCLSVPVVDTPVIRTNGRLR